MIYSIISSLCHSLFLSLSTFIPPSFLSSSLSFILFFFLSAFPIICLNFFNFPSIQHSSLLFTPTLFSFLFFLSLFHSLFFLAVFSHNLTQSFSTFLPTTIHLYSLPQTPFFPFFLPFFSFALSIFQ